MAIVSFFIVRLWANETRISNRTAYEFRRIFDRHKKTTVQFWRVVVGGAVWFSVLNDFQAFAKCPAPNFGEGLVKEKTDALPFLMFRIGENLRIQHRW